jgi:plastocyanin
MGRALIWCSIAATLGLAPTSAAGAVTHEVGANGNVITGGLSFTPPTVDAKVGDMVRWTNTDVLVPHTATEDHGLWDLTGTYGETPLNPPGFGPGDTRERVFEAGKFSYFCEVHPVQMRGTVSVRPKVSHTGSRSHPRLRVVWSTDAPAEGQVFDVQRRSAGGWHTVREATTKTAGTFPGKHGRFRVRLRSAADPAAASEYSPAASA